MGQNYLGLGKTVPAQYEAAWGADGFGVRPHRHVFEAAADYGGLAPSYLLCVCGQARRLQDFAGPRLAPGLPVRLTARGERLLEQKARSSASDDGKFGCIRGWAFAGDEGRIVRGPRVAPSGEVWWDCLFRLSTVAVTAEMVEAA